MMQDDGNEGWEGRGWRDDGASGRVLNECLRRALGTGLKEKRREGRGELAMRLEQRASTQEHTIVAHGSATSCGLCGEQATYKCDGIVGG